MESKYTDAGNGVYWAGTAEEEHAFLNDPVRLYEEAKATRQAAVGAITVTVNGKVFDGDEISQTRITRAILGMQLKNITDFPGEWTLADNSKVSVTLAELSEVLVLAGARQSELW